MKAFVNHPIFNVVCILAVINLMVFMSHMLSPTMIANVGFIPTVIIFTLMGWLFGKLARIVRDHLVDKYNK